MDSGAFSIAADPAVLWHLPEVTTQCQKAAEGIAFLHLSQQVRSSSQSSLAPTRWQLKLCTEVAEKSWVSVTHLCDRLATTSGKTQLVLVNVLNCSFSLSESTVGWPWEHFCSLESRVSVATRVSLPAGLMSPRRGGAVREMCSLSSQAVAGVGASFVARHPGSDSAGTDWLRRALR